MKKIFLSVFFLILMSYLTLAVQNQKSIHDFPIQLSYSKGNNDTLVIYITGDGGWNKFSEKLVQGIERKGYGVVSLNSRKYFRNKKTPDIFVQDIEYLSDYFMKEWNKKSLIIVGYSFGADVSAFLPKRLSRAVLTKTDHFALLSPSISTDFVINLKDLIGDSRNTKRKYKIAPEIIDLKFPVICIFGMDEDLKLKDIPIKSKWLKIHKLPGNHHYKENMALVIKTIGL